MNNLLNKGNTFYFIASSLATFTLFTSLVLINAPNSLILAIAALSTLALLLLYKIISKMENEFAQKERELRGEITLEREATNRGIEELNSQLQEKEKWLSEELEKTKDQLKRKERMLSSEYQKLCSENEKLKNDLRGQSLKMQDKLGKLRSESCELFFKFTVREKLLKMMLEKQLKEREELCKEVRKIYKDRKILGGKVEELHRKEEALNKGLSEQQYKIKEITRKNEYLSKELKKKFEELDKANGLIEDQYSKLREIEEDYSNKVKILKNLLLEKDSQIEQLECELSKPSPLLCGQNVVKILSEELVQCNN